MSEQKDIGKIKENEKFSLLAIYASLEEARLSLNRLCHNSKPA